MMSMRKLGTPIAVGRTAEVYAWTEGHILKLFHEGFPAERARDEARSAGAVYAAGLSVPAIGEIIEVDGRLGLVYERVIGISMMDSLLSRPWTFIRAAHSLAELQVAMHAVEGFDGLPAQHEMLRAKIQAAQTLPPNLREAVLSILDGMPAGDRLCHGDFHPGNIITTGKGPVIIDWIDATRGSPLADVARSSLLTTMGSPPEDTPMRGLIGLMSGWFHAAYLRRYFQLSLADRRELDAWRLVNAAARLIEGVPEVPRLLAFIQSKLVT
jgi:uncharacterized protein (TIGR02172 family)